MSKTRRCLPVSPSTSCCIGHCWRRRGARPAALGDTFDRTRLDNLTLGLDRYARRNMHRLPVAIMRLRPTRRRTAQFFGTYDAVLTPVVADETPPPRSPRPDRRLSADHRPTGQLGCVHAAAERHRRARYLTAAGRIRERYASRHDALCRRRARRRGCWNWPSNSKRPGPGPASSPALGTDEGCACARCSSLPV